ncbi:MAG: hypothetical protein BWY31_02749 [Lentisphaerae bacterium ADurb.Bin242]|nr:MAG: hypothetical protein BWY31_02749 [Lentisphaerae bacterium ADurb.Bin242]
MKTCEKFMKDAMLGMNSPELEKHLGGCPECASRVDMLRLLNEIPSGNPEVPPELDSAVLGYALKKMPSHRRHTPLFMLKFVWLPVAAAFMICFGLVYALHPYYAGKTASAGVGAAKTSIHYEMMDNLDSEIFLLSSQIQETSVKLRSIAAYSTLSQNRIN